MTDAALAEVITRPDGRPYRPRKVTAHALSDDIDWMSGVMVTGTHDVDRALTLAQMLVLQELGHGYRPVCPRTGWWRDGFECGQRRWVEDDERGMAGVMFGKIEEKATS